MVAIDPTKIARAKLQGIQTTLGRTPPDQKGQPISLSLAVEFNRVLEALRTQYEDLADSLPQDLSTRGPGASVGLAAVSFLDLEALSEQVLNLLALVD